MGILAGMSTVHGHYVRLKIGCGLEFVVYNFLL